MSPRKQRAEHWLLFSCMGCFLVLMLHGHYFMTLPLVERWRERIGEREFLPAFLDKWCARRRRSAFMVMDTETASFEYHNTKFGSVYVVVVVSCGTKKWWGAEMVMIMMMMMMMFRESWRKIIIIIIIAERPIHARCRHDMPLLLYSSSEH
jgi:hypothetical protein